MAGESLSRALGLSGQARITYWTLKLNVPQQDAFSAHVLFVPKKQHIGAK